MADKPSDESRETSRQHIAGPNGQASRNRALDWVQSKWQGNRECPICGSSTWLVGDISATPQLTHDGNVNLGSVIPAIPLVCTTCGFMHLFNATVAQVLADMPTGEESPPVEEDHRGR